MKKIVTIILCALVAFNLCVSAVAFTPQTVKSLHPLFAEQITDFALDGDFVDASQLESIAARPGSTLEITLAGKGADADLFFDQNNMPVNTADVTISKIRAARVSVSADVWDGANLLRSVELNVKNAGSPASKPVINISFIQDFTSIEAGKFSFDVFILIGGVRQNQSKITISGELRNEELAVYSDTYSISPDGAVMVADGYIPSIEIYAGCDLTVEASMSSGGRYLAAASKSGDSADLAMLEKHNKLVDVVKLDVEGFGAWQIKGVRIDSEQILYVYDSDGRNVGMTDQLLPLLEKYYLASKAIEF